MSDDGSKNGGVRSPGAEAGVAEGFAGAPLLDRVSLKEKLCFGTGDIANSLAAASTGFWLLFYLTEVAKIHPSLAGLSLMIGRAIDAICDPIVGWISDRTVSRWGKRRPFLLYGAFFYGLTFFAIWVVPDFEAEFHRWLYVTAALIAFNISLAFVFIPYTSLTAAITNDYDERTALTGYRMTFGQLAFLIGALVPNEAAKWVKSDGGKAFFENTGLQELFGSWAGTTHQGFFVFGVLSALIMTATMLVTFAGTRERHSDSEHGEEGNPLAYMKALVGLARSSQPFRISLSVKLLSTCAITVVSVNLNYYLDYVVEAGAQKTFIFSVLLISGIVAAPVWVLLSKRIGKVELYRIIAIAYAALLPSLLFIDASHSWMIKYIAVVAGAIQSAALIIPWSIIPDVVEYDEYHNGVRREGLLYGGTSFAYKLATGVAIFLAGVALSAFGYEPGQDQSETAKLGIRLVIGLLPSMLLIASVYYSRNYPLSADAHKELLTKLAARKREESEERHT